MGGNATSAAGTPAETLRAALARLEALPGWRLGAVSRFFRTPAFPPGAGPDFVNAVAALHGPADPEALLALLHGLEAHFGRRRDRRWGPRTLDLDLLDCGGQVAPDPATWRLWRDLPPVAQRISAPDRLILPHPRIEDRAFVLIPLRDIAPDWRHPVTGVALPDLIARLPAEDVTAVVPL